MLRLVRATIVILAQSHNPSIIAPEWVKNVLSINEAPGNFIHTPPFSLFDSTSYILTVDAERLELVSKSLDDEHMLACGQVAGAYLRALPHIPYKSLGLNYIWEYSPEQAGKPLPQIEVKMDGLDFEEVFKGQSIKYSGTIRVVYKPYILALNISYKRERVITFNYNFSYTIKTIRQAANTAKSFLPLKSHSEQLTISMAEGRK